MKKTLVLVFSNLKTDARVARQIRWARKKSEVTVVCFEAEPSSDVKIIPIRQTKLTFVRKALMAVCLILRQYEMAYRLFHDYDYLISLLKDQHFDLIIANDIDTLPLAFRMKNKARIIFDAHEYAPRHFENNKIWKMFFQPFYVALCKKYIPQVDSMLTVGLGLAREYETNFGIEPVVITNATYYHEIEPGKILPEKIRLVHHGIANKSRKLELMIDLMNDLDDRFTLDMYLLTSDYASGKTKSYIESLKQRIGGTRIRILPAVKNHLVVETLNHYDIGVFLIPPVNFNYANTLPNKLFEYIQARLGIAIGPTPEMASIVNTYDNGVVGEDFAPQGLAIKLNALTPERVHQFKINSARAAHVLNAEENEKIFIELMQKILSH